MWMTNGSDIIISYWTEIICLVQLVVSSSGWIRAMDSVRFVKMFDSIRCLGLCRVRTTYVRCTDIAAYGTSAGTTVGKFQWHDFEFYCRYGTHREKLCCRLMALILNVACQLSAVNTRLVIFSSGRGQHTHTHTPHCTFNVMDIR